LITLLNAYQQLRARRRDVPTLALVLPQQSKPSRANLKLSSFTTAPGIRCLHAVTDHSLASLYSAALMTVIPSFEEGFGLPVIESMACGTPVACSSAASLPEIAGDSAIYFPPDSAEAMATAMEQLLDSDELRHKLSTQGLERATEYSTSRAAAGYASVLSLAIAGTGS
jgi:alpha-1,3-rhamnosyl/mannosyltransferase